jgi:hypothetical protein
MNADERGQIHQNHAVLFSARNKMKRMAWPFMVRQAHHERLFVDLGSRRSVRPELVEGQRPGFCCTLLDSKSALIGVHRRFPTGFRGRL